MLYLLSDFNLISRVADYKSLRDIFVEVSMSTSIYDDQNGFQYGPNQVSFLGS